MSTYARLGHSPSLTPTASSQHRLDRRRIATPLVITGAQTSANLP